MSLDTIMAEESKVEAATQKQQTENVQPNPRVKGGYFIIGDTPAAEVFIEEDFEEDALMVGDMVRDFCTQEIKTPFLQTGKELQATNPEDKAKVLAILKRAGELGLCSVTIPEAYGGMDLDTKTNTLMSVNLAHGYSFATTLGAQTSIGCLPIVYYGNDAQKEKYLPKIATAEYVAAYALTEPTAGSDANSGKTKATLSQDGENYILNGQKIWISNGGFADVYVVFAKIDTDENLSAFIVERNFEGFSVGAEEKKFGIKGSSTVQIFFDNCKVPVENLLGEREGGFKMALNILNGGRLKAGSGGAGAAATGLEQAVIFAKERKQFGTPISEFGAIQYKIGDIAMKTFATLAATYRTSDLIDRKIAELKSEGLSESQAKIQATAEFAIEASIIKVQGSELACYALDEVMQIHGGMGYSAETGIGMGYRDARITKIYEGTNEINSMLAVGELSKRALQTKEIDLFGAGKKIPGFVLSRLNPFRDKSDAAEQIRILQGLKNTFLYVVGAAGKKLKKKMVDEQEIIMNLSAILQKTFLAESAWLKVQKLSSRVGVDKQKLEAQQQMVQLYLYDALETSKAAAKEAIASFETGSAQKNHNRMINLLLKPYYINPKEVRRNIAKAVIEAEGFKF